MGESWMGFAIGGFALAIALPMAVVHHWREWRRARLLRHLDHLDWWYAPRGGARAWRIARRTGRGGPGA
ncbi:protein of unknown function [Burkholderia multivorans]